MVPREIWSFNFDILTRLSNLASNHPIIMLYVFGGVVCSSCIDGGIDVYGSSPSRLRLLKSSFSRVCSRTNIPATRYAFNNNVPCRSNTFRESIARLVFAAAEWQQPYHRRKTHTVLVRRRNCTSQQRCRRGNLERRRHGMLYLSLLYFGGTLIQRFSA